MGHGRDEGHKDMHFSTEPHDGVILTNTISQGRSDRFDFTLGTIVGNLQGDLLLTVTFEDGEAVHERLPMTPFLTEWVGEIVHSKQMRGEMAQEAP
jgi:hypothetical protein